MLGQYFIFNLIIIFAVIFVQFNLNFLKLNNFVHLQIDIKFNSYINIVMIFLIKFKFLLNIFV